MVEHQGEEYRLGDHELVNGELGPDARLPEGAESQATSAADLNTGMIRTLDGEIAGDDFAQDAINYQILLGKIDTLLENLDLDA